MVNYKLYYFSFMGRGEYARYIFAYAGVEYDDIRVESGSEEWTKLKKSKVNVVHFLYKIN